jgi:hypothetical protein
MSKFYNVLFLTAAIAFIYRNLLFSPLNLGPDFNFVGYDHFRTYSAHPYLWDSSLNNGFGGYILFTILFQPYSQFARLWTSITTEPFLLHKLIFLIPTILLGLISTIYTAHNLFRLMLARVAFVLLYLLNPYIILLISGGQIGVAMAYAFLPAFFTTWYQLGLRIHHHHRITTLRMVLTTLTFPIFLTLDARIFLLGLMLVIPIYLYLFYSHRRHLQPILRTAFKLALLSTFFTLLLHAHWLLPAVYLEPVALPQGYTTTSSAQYFSFTRFAHAFTWSHPNYPQNIFGKVNEIQPAALIFPLLAFLAIRLRPQKLVIYFSLLAIFTTFLAKGTNEPLGQVYASLFTILPGFNLFRDSTKFYVLISLAYAYLICISVAEIQHRYHTQHLLASISHLRSTILSRFPRTPKISQYRPKVRLKRAKHTLFHSYLRRIRSLSLPILTLLRRIPTAKLYFVTIFLLIIIAWWPTFSNQILGTLGYRTYPESYKKLQELLQADPQFGRVLWLPTRELYGYTSLTHPAINFDLLTRLPTCQRLFCHELPTYPPEHRFTAQDLAAETDMLLQKLNQPNIEAIFQELSIKYLVLVPDYDQNIYTLDYKPYPQLYEQYRTFLDQHPNLRQIYAADNLILYQTTNSAAFISDRLTSQPIAYQMLSPTHYQIFYNGGVGELHVSQSYDPRWQLSTAQSTYIAERTSIDTLLFPVNTDPTTFDLRYVGQQYADLGWVISRVSLFFALIYIAILLSKRQQT